MQPEVTHDSPAIATTRASARRLFTTLIIAAVASAVFSASSHAFTRDTAHVPHPRLVDLEDSEAVDLGRYECESRAPNLNCSSIFDFSRMNYDPFNHRLVIFGGGHAATGRTDIDAFDMTELTWRSLYPTMSCEEVAEGDIDPRGFHRKTGHPVARHTYDQNVVAEFNGQGWLLMFSTEGFSGRCHKYKAPIKASAAFPLTDPDAGWTYGPEGLAPWGYAGTAEYDPISGFVILLSSRATYMWVYDPVTKKVVSSMRLQGARKAKNSSNLLFNPRDGHLYFIDRETLQVRRLVLDRDTWRNSKMSPVVTTGTAPPKMRNFAYDSRNHVIGGIVDGKFHALDLTTFEWISRTISETSDTGGRVGRVYSHAIDYDPVNNVFVFVSGKKRQRRTWAYRFKN